MKNPDGTATSDTVKLTVIAHPPKITKQPTSVTVESGEDAVFSVEAEYPGTYQWYYRKSAKAKWAKVSGGTEATLTITATASKNGYQYKCVVKNSDGTATSNIVKLTVIAHSPTNTEQPESVTTDGDESVTNTEQPESVTNTEQPGSVTVESGEDAVLPTEQ